ncbi:hypothetical protein [Halobaculum rarum]|uniref:hypothetical protein n=1 Tax=Halobaculum rarum TaxID=3075122 RepID=UPI0032AFE132
MEDPETPDSLRARVDALERQLAAMQAALETATNRDLPLLKGTIRSLVATDVETIDEFPMVGAAFGERVTAHGNRLDQLEARVDLVTRQSDTSTKAEKIAAVLTFAQNKADRTGKVAVTPAEIRGCTGVSRRYAYDLVEAIAADVDGVRIRESRQVKTGSGTKRKQKALLVDCEAVHGLDDAVNSFTTANGGDGEV